MYLYDRNMATNTNLKNANSSSNYYVIMMIQNLKKNNNRKFPKNLYPEARSAELKQLSKRSASIL